MSEQSFSTININISRRISFYTPGQQFAARVLLIAGLLVICSLGSALAVKTSSSMNSTASLDEIPPSCPTWISRVTITWLQLVERLIDNLSSLWRPQPKTNATPRTIRSHRTTPAYTARAAQSSLYYQQCLFRIEASCRDQYSGVVLALRNVGVVYHNFGKHTEALEYFEQFFTMRHQPCEKISSAEIAIALQNVGNGYQRLGKHTKALGYFRQAITMYQKCYGNEVHPDIAAALKNLGACYEHLGKYYSALRCYQKAFTMYQKLYGEEGFMRMCKQPLTPLKIEF